MARNILKNLPNLLTFCNMAIGLSVIFVMIQNPTTEIRQSCCYLIFFAALIDILDGYLARRFHAVTDIGKQLDSFADLITFGIAPLTLFIIESQVNSVITFAIFLLFPMAGAYRLARYNSKSSTQHFKGLPITAAGTILVLMHLAQGVVLLNPLLLVQVSIIFLAIMMVSRFSIKRPFYKEFINENH